MIFKKERVKKVILLPDFHHPYHNKKAVKAVFEFIKWFKPDEINLLGDALNMDFRTVEFKKNINCPVCGKNSSITSL